MKQAFLKRFNPWGDTRHQQQDAWNKFKFDMTKDDVDAFIVDMKMLASILGHNEDVIMEKFKDIFPDPNIEAALIAMDDFVAMQAKAKQLIQIYKPAHDSTMASATILVHTAQNAPTKGKSSQPKSNQHQLAPINQPQDPQTTGDMDYTGGQRGQGHGRAIEVHVAVEKEGTLITSLIIRTEEPAAASHKGIFSITEVEVKIIPFEGNEDSGMEMTPIIVTEIPGIEIPKAKVILIGAEDRMVVEVRDIVIREEGEDGTLISNIKTQGTSNKPNLQTQIIIAHPLWDTNIDTQSHMNSIHILSNNNTSLKYCQPHHNKPQISVNCIKVKAIMIINANLQVTLWPDTQKAFNQGHSYNHQDPNQGEWLNGNNDNNDPNGQPFQ